MERRARVHRTTRETNIVVEVLLDGQGRAKVELRPAFLAHILEVFAHHSLMDLTVTATGDLVHHLVEDVALALGAAMNQALGEREGIRRFGSALVPLDEALALASVDLARRPFSVTDLKLQREMIEDMPREDVAHFLRSLATAMEACVHIVVLYGENDHHKIEAGMKAFALALRTAMSSDPQRSGVPSSKGVI
ncbi:MAG: imidazoleglycerol-phosphate dehydratase HisB [Blastocatellia bacterium]|nr:imidazoleglycerol-phosphate dehydratase HisB [Blastocatellia bacterium]MCS7157564.1 imidazoleglycerol-phosphate dehydratase HisB [Blastocatellia bacterium]MCX7753516.1 imidazoleglycerol-phosphate dehydratase HisB [Blastocatellia bacterium]MDW8166932.1 imidazoleglycerol-phosphate dehydratase HisB [Acidobacteriota bacterium]MDW8257509.1 imidazoleglycerol-phosphate dehydratase HisB [Acidobacteriota bacterium]